MKRKSDIPSVVVVVTLAVACLHLAWAAQYGGGTGDPNDPYQIWTPEQMNAIGADPNSWSKCFKLMADIDLSAYDGQNGRPRFNAIGTWSYGSTANRGTGAGRGIVIGPEFGSATCVFDGNGHTVSNLTLNPGNGLFTSLYGSGATVKNLTLVRPTITSSTGTYAGALMGSLSYGSVTNCHVVDGFITGIDYVGGLVGYNSSGTITDCHVSGLIMGRDYVGGLMGNGSATRSFAMATVVGRYSVGGLVGNGSATNCYATGTVLGENYVGGLIGRSGGCTNCYATALVTVSPSAKVSYIYASSLLGYSYAGSATGSFWDIETSGLGTSVYGEGKATAQMQTVATFLDWGVGDNAGVWTIDEGNDYPHLAWEQRPGVAIGPLQFSDLAVGTGTSDDPYLISKPIQLYLLTRDPNQWSKCFKLTADLNMADYADKDLAAIGTSEQPFTGVFDGNGHTISKYVHTSAAGDYYGGLFGCVVDPNRGPCAPPPNDVVMIKNLGLIDPLITGQARYYSGALAGCFLGGTITGCYVDGGLVTDGNEAHGGLVGYNAGIIEDCFASIAVLGGLYAGGLAGANNYGVITNCYSTGFVQGSSYAGGLVGYNGGTLTASFWDTETSRQTGSAGGTGLTTEQMRAGSTFLDMGWDFVGETANGTADIWRIDEGKGYPRLWWQAAEQ